MSAADKLREADVLEARAKALRDEAAVIHRGELLGQPLLTRLVFASDARCPCGAGLAYDPAGESGKPIFGYWDCSAILLGTATRDVTHEARLPFAFYEIKSEGQPSADGRTTRP